MKYIAFLRGINVGGSGILPMSKLKTLCEDIGFRDVRTYIQSGNVVFESELAEYSLIEKLEARLHIQMGKHIPVSIRTIDELKLVLQQNPFSKEESAKVGVMFFARPIQNNFVQGISTTTAEEVRISKRELYIYYPNGMGRSKLKLPNQNKEGTVRNINTIQKILTTMFVS